MPERREQGRADPTRARTLMPTGALTKDDACTMEAMVSQLALRQGRRQPVGAAMASLFVPPGHAATPAVCIAAAIAKLSLTLEAPDANLKVHTMSWWLREAGSGTGRLRSTTSPGFCFQWPSRSPS